MKKIEVKKLKKINLPNLPIIEIKKKGASKKKVLAEVLVGAAIASGLTYTVKKMIDAHHARAVAKKTTKKTAKRKAAKKTKK